MNLALSRIESQQINASWLNNSQPHFFPHKTNSKFYKTGNARFNISSRIILKGSEINIPKQNFLVSVNPNKIELESLPEGNFPKIKFIANMDSPSVEIGIKLSDKKNVESEILFTRLLFAIRESESLTLLNQNENPLDIRIEQRLFTNFEELEYRAKFFRKLAFIENFFRTKFQLPNSVSEDEVRITEVIYKGLTEGEFTIPTGDYIEIEDFLIEKNTLNKPPFSKYGNFTYKFDSEKIQLFGKFLSVGKIIINIEKAGIANPRVIRSLKVGDKISRFKLSIFDFQIKHIFEKYFNNEKLLRNKQKLEKFRRELRSNEPESLVNLMNEPLTEISKNSAMEIMGGLLHYYDFPDRLSVLQPKLEENQWRVPIALTYPKYKAVWLEDAFVDVKTGDVKLKISFDELLKRGRLKAKEVFSIA